MCQALLQALAIHSEQNKTPALLMPILVMYLTGVLVYHLPPK